MPNPVVRAMEAQRKRRKLHAAVGETHEQLDFLLGRGALDFEGQGFASWHGNRHTFAHCLTRLHLCVVILEHCLA